MEPIDAQAEEAEETRSTSLTAFDPDRSDAHH
jgi:hypothetical protein